MFDKIFGPHVKQFPGIKLFREELGDGRVRVTCRKYGFGGEYKLNDETKAMDEFAKAEHARTILEDQPKPKVEALVPDESKKASV